MLGAFQSSRICLGGLVWKTPWRLSATRKANHRKRLKLVDSVIQAVKESGVECASLCEALKLPKESEMLPRDKYTVFHSKSVGYRKGIHKVPKWTRITQRVNPRGF